AIYTVPPIRGKPPRRRAPAAMNPADGRFPAIHTYFCDPPPDHRPMLERLFSLLRPPETKASRTAHLIQLESGMRARWTPRDYAALAREGYVCNAIVHRAVRLVAENVGCATYLAYEGAALRDRHPLLDLLARPNPRQEGAAFLEAVCAHL